MGTVLLTGSTGFLGAHIAFRLVTETDHAIVALVRAKDLEAARLRLSRAWWDWPELVNALDSRVKIVLGDVSQPNLGLNDLEYSDLVHGLTRLSHVSTAYVAGGRTGEVSEDSLSDLHGFYSRYELSKYEGEQLVQQARQQLPISIFRPGLVVGDSKTGAIKTFNTLYFPIRLYLTRHPVIIPASPSLRINMVPVDYVADAVVRLAFKPEAAGLNFHLVAPWEKLPTAAEFIGFLRTWARGRMNMKLPHPVFLALPVPATRARYKAQAIVNSGGKGILEGLLTIVPYFKERRRFRRDNIDRLLGAYDFRWREVLSAMLEFAVSRSFMHRSERTVHEQILFRLKSKSLPVTYYDVVQGQIIKRNTANVRDEIVSAAAAMSAVGVGKGDRVALAGLNCSRYLIIDVAIGLLGAVSVPLYNTSPPSEVDQILKSSQAKLLFLGSPVMLERLDELQADVPVISFSRNNPGTMPARKVIPWEEFLAKGQGSKISTAAPVTFGDLATIRYTSGTTGQVKGVCFYHDNLRWMSETTCSMMNSWRALNSQISYLSYLPLNHVVEGMLANYSAYYTPSPFHIYFIEDINDLPGTLRKIRPQVFFSVPRLYEKIWESLAKTGIGRSYINSREGLKRRLLRFVLRRGVLKKAGLNRCAQLVVGSAPMPQSLLRNFRELGIEIYNGYGLTEAPLVTMNKLGENRIDTVGEPLPGTTLCIAEDGEILVKGPQVARGYLNGNACSHFDDGWLATGDLGHLTEENSLILHGRKKDIIVTSYGKNIHPTKIESMLRCIPGIAEAMLIGDARPFCTAILWVSRDGPDISWLAGVEKAIIEINKQLSHPEQVKRWAILKNELSIERGEITASLKLKRSEVTRRLVNIVEALYSRLPSAPVEAMHIGGLAAERES